MLKKKVVKDTLELEQELRAEIAMIDKEMNILAVRKEALIEEILNIELSPFKVGDYVIATVSSGRSKKEQKCLIENNHGLAYLRPMNDNGELSGRHFFLSPERYSELKKC